MAVALFIDKACLDIAFRSVDDREIYYPALRSYLEAQESDRVVEAYAFDATPEGGWNFCHRKLAQAGISPKVYRMGYESFTDGSGNLLQRRVQKGVDVGLALQLIKSYELRRWDRLVLAATDADFAEPIQRLHDEHGVLVSFLVLPNKLSHALRPYVDRWYDLSLIGNHITRPVYFERTAC